jgi:hypothetical protein
MVRGLTAASTEGARSAMLCPASHLSVQNKTFLPSPRVAVVAAVLGLQHGGRPRLIGKLAHSQELSVRRNQAQRAQMAQPMRLRSRMLNPRVNKMNSATYDPA